jgi:transposase InsO family protein
MQSGATWLTSKARFIARGSSLDIGYIESFNGTLRNEFHSREALDNLFETSVLEGQKYNIKRLPTRARLTLNYQTPSEYVVSYTADSALTSAAG